MNNLQLYSTARKFPLNLQELDDLRGKFPIKADKPSSEECYLAADFNTNEFATGQYCYIKDKSNGKWMVLVELDHWQFAHYVNYPGGKMGEVQQYKTIAIAKKVARYHWHNCREVHPRHMKKAVFTELLKVS